MPTKGISATKLTDYYNAYRAKLIEIAVPTQWAREALGELKKHINELGFAFKASESKFVKMKEEKEGEPDGVAPQS